MNNADFGMTVQKLICDEYNIAPNEHATKQYNSNYNSHYTDVKKLFSQIFNEIGAKPIRCTSFEDGQKGDTYSPHNFYLNNGLTLSIKTTKSRKNAKVAPQVVGQAGYDNLNYHFGHLLSSRIENQDDIKELMWNHLDQALPIFLDYLFLSDILLWIYIEGGEYKYKIIYRGEKPDIIWEKEKISFTKTSILD